MTPTRHQLFPLKKMNNSFAEMAAEFSTDVSVYSTSAETPTTIDYRTLWQYKFYISLFKYVSPIIIFGGTLGNILTLFVMFTKSFRSTPSSLIFSGLAIADSGALCTGLMRLWIRQASNLDIRNLSAASCQLHFFMSYFFRHLESSFLAMLTIERMISVYFPLKCREICNRRNVLIAIISCVLLLTAINMHVFFIVELRNHSITLDTGVVTYFGCRVLEKFMPFFRIMYWVDSTFAAFAPLTIIFVGNLLIVKKLMLAQKRRSKMNAESKDDMRSITVMLVVVSVFFLILLTPEAIYFTGLGLQVWPRRNIIDVMNLNVFYVITSLVSYTNCAINFILYCVSGTKFRHALLRVFCKCLPNAVPETSIRATSVTEVTEVPKNNLQSRTAKDSQV